MLKMLKTILKAVFYIVFISFLLVFIVYLFQDLVAYYTVPDAPIPLVMKAVRWIMGIPVLGSLISAFLTTLT